MHIFIKEKLSLERSRDLGEMEAFDSFTLSCSIGKITRLAAKQSLFTYQNERPV
jgi:hypothetical protein